MRTDCYGDADRAKVAGGTLDVLVVCAGQDGGTLCFGTGADVVEQGNDGAVLVGGDDVGVGHVADGGAVGGAVLALGQDFGVAVR